MTKLIAIGLGTLVLAFAAVAFWVLSVISELLGKYHEEEKSTQEE